MPLFMPGGQRFALRDSRPGASGKPLPLWVPCACLMAFPPLPDVNGGRRRPRAGLGYLRDLSALCGSFLFFLTSIRPENLSGLMTPCINSFFADRCAT